jgi:hypothetical protein
MNNPGKDLWEKTNKRSAIICIEKDKAGKNIIRLDPEYAIWADSQREQLCIVLRDIMKTKQCEMKNFSPPFKITRILNENGYSFF